MESLLKALVDVLAGLGLAGVLIAGLTYYVYYLVKKRDELQDARLGEYKLLIQLVNENTTVMRDLQKTITYCEKVGNRHDC